MRQTRILLLEALESWRTIDEARRERDRLPTDSAADARRGQLNGKILASQRTLKKLEDELRLSLQEAQWLADPIETLHLESRITNALRRAGIETIQDLIEEEPRRLEVIPNLGALSVMQIGIALIKKAAAEGG